MLQASGLPYFSSALCYWLVSTGPGWQTKGESQFVHTSLLALVKPSLVRRLLDVLVNVGSSDQLFGPVPHRQPRCRVIKKHPVITCPYYTPDTGQQNKHTFKSTNRMKGTELTQQTCCFEQRWRRLTMACQGSDLWRWAELSELPSPPLSSLLLSAPVGRSNIYFWVYDSSDRSRGFQIWLFTDLLYVICVFIFVLLIFHLHRLSLLLGQTDPELFCFFLWITKGTNKSKFFFLSH